MANILVLGFRSSRKIAFPEYSSHAGHRMTDCFLKQTDNRGGSSLRVTLKHPYHHFLEPDKVLL